MNELRGALYKHESETEDTKKRDKLIKDENKKC
jgi:hypothetical protein